MQGGRGRKRRLGDHQATLQTQNYSLRPRCPTRSNSTPQLLPITPLGSIPHTPCLQPALRILREESREAATVADDTMYEINVQEDVKPFILISTLNTSAPSTQHRMDEVPQETPVVPRNEVVVEKCKTHDGPSSTRCLSPSRSLNLTEFTRALQDHGSDDSDEVDSGAYERVRHHKVKMEIAPLVGAIFDKYGDITAESDVKSPSVVASLTLERLCKVYKRLEQGNFFKITSGEINEMLEELRVYEYQKFNVGWLIGKVEEIREAKKSTEEYLLRRGEAANCLREKKGMEEDVRLKRRHIAMVEQKILTLEQQKKDKEDKANEHMKMALDIKARVKALASQSLVHGLL